jgi:hypothetical protein
MRAAVRVAQEVGAGLGGGAVLFGGVQEKAKIGSVLF